MEIIEKHRLSFIIIRICSNVNNKDNLSKQNKNRRAHDKSHKVGNKIKRIRCAPKGYFSKDWIFYYSFISHFFSQEIEILSPLIIMFHICSPIRCQAFKTMIPIRRQAFKAMSPILRQVFKTIVRSDAKHLRPSAYTFFRYFVIIKRFNCFGFYTLWISNIRLLSFLVKINS